MADVGKLSKPLSVLLVSKQIPWIIQGEMGRQGYTTVGDLADRWNSLEEARLKRASMASRPGSQSSRLCASFKRCGQHGR